MEIVREKPAIAQKQLGGSGMEVFDTASPED
jgi:hypothetical protein